MMNYEEFKSTVAEKIKDFLPKDFAVSTVEINKMTKVNETLDCMNVMLKSKTDGEIVNVSPNIYLNHLYEGYKSHGELEKTLEHAADMIQSGYEQIKDDAVEISLAGRKDKVIMMLVNTEKNKELLETVPHESFLDLSVIYRVVMNMGNYGLASTIVSEELLETLEISREELHELALENTKRMLPSTIKNLSEVISCLIDAKKNEIVSGPELVKSPLYVLSNTQGINGATVLLYSEGLKSLSKMLQQDLYVIPSSIHEVMALSTKAADIGELKTMVREINATQVASNEVLSDEVYLYERATGKLKIA